ncbi:hypothetical protein SM757_04945 [Azohydromonas lata]|uniref:Uncharacterized protein n=1 Tax=Azohydromonas lata TaxID=45677 RepID=A0ABU5I9Y0_9BURK|nr:hypothetical protein [Azohydromonas lata]
MNTPIGKIGNVLSIYGAFPQNSEFTHPRHVPHQAQWGRFRLDRASRLVGFVVPKEYELREKTSEGFYFDCNTFYVVFLDGTHSFYKTKK